MERVWVCDLYNRDRRHQGCCEVCCCVLFALGNALTFNTRPLQLRDIENLYTYGSCSGFQLTMLLLRSSCV